jgi:hypothetical protein
MEITKLIHKVFRKLKYIFSLPHEQNLKLFFKKLPSNLMRLKLRFIYENKSLRNTTTLELPNYDIINLGNKLSDEVLFRYKDKYQSSKYRFLFQVPPDGLGIIWFSDLIQTLEHTGISCASVKWNDPKFEQVWETFHPNIFITLDLPIVLKSLDLDYINSYKTKYGCMRLFTPVNKYDFPNYEMNSEDKWRFNLACTGQTADAYFCMFVNEFYSQFWKEWEEFGFKYLSLPHGCNPIYQYPREAKKDLDFFMATSHSDERLKLTWQYMNPIFRKYHGLWAGAGWDFGLGLMDSKQLPDFYARAKVIPNPLARFLINFPSEITERAFSATACGAFQITDWTPVTERFFSADELITARSNEEFLNKFEYYIKHGEERDQIITNGMKHVFSEHTYFHRIDKLIAFLDNNSDLFYSPQKKDNQNKQKNNCD